MDTRTNPQPVEIRLKEDGSVDEIFTNGADVHLERMADGHWWLGLTLPGEGSGEGHRLLVNFYSDAHIECTAEVEALDDDAPAAEAV